MWAHRAYSSGWFSRTHKILEAVNPVRAGLAVIWISRSLPTSWVISSHWAAVRWSHQMMDRRSTFPSLSSITRPCICPEMPTPLMSSGATPLSAVTCRRVWQAASHQSWGSCSAQPLRS